MNAWDDAYDAQQERMQEDWMAEKRGEVRCEVCDGNGLAINNDPCLSCRGTGFRPAVPPHPQDQENAK